jgi:hypothetical protein
MRERHAEPNLGGDDPNPERRPSRFKMPYRGRHRRLEPGRTSSSNLTAAPGARPAPPPRARARHGRGGLRAGRACGGTILTSCSPEVRGARLRPTPAASNRRRGRPAYKIAIYDPKDDGTYVVEFRTADGESLAISVPRGETAVLRKAGKNGHTSTATRAPPGKTGPTGGSVTSFP